MKTEINILVTEERLGQGTQIRVVRVLATYLGDRLPVRAFIHRDLDVWVITEPFTGLPMGRGLTKEKAIKEVENKLNSDINFDEAVARCFERTNILANYVIV